MQISVISKESTNSQITYHVIFEVITDKDEHEIEANITIISADYMACPEIFTEIVEDGGLENNEELVGELEKAFMDSEKEKGNAKHYEMP